MDFDSEISPYQIRPNIVNPLAEASDRVYLNYYTRAEVDEFYEFCRIAHELIFNEPRLAHLFINPSIDENYINNEYMWPGDHISKGGIRLGKYMYKIRYNVNSPEGSLHWRVLTIALHAVKIAHTRIEALTICKNGKPSAIDNYRRFDMLINGIENFNDYNWTVDGNTRYITNADERLDLFKLWVPIPTISPKGAKNPFEEIKQIYYEKKEHGAKMDAVALGLNPNMLTVNSTWQQREAFTDDLMKMFYGFSEPEYPSWLPRA